MCTHIDSRRLRLQNIARIRRVAHGSRRRYFTAECKARIFHSRVQDKAAIILRKSE
jgi:hypothetical protein